MDKLMFCYQCQETAGCTGCTKFGVCGKSPELANMQDLLIYVTKGLSEVTTRLRSEDKKINKELNHFITLNLFTTITNANFDNEVYYSRLKVTLRLKEDLISKLDNKENLSEAALWNASSNEEIDKKSNSDEVGVPRPSLSRELIKHRDLGYIKFNRKLITITNKNELEEKLFENN